MCSVIQWPGAIISVTICAHIDNRISVSANAVEWMGMWFVHEEYKIYNL